jgi:hypothetical protein
MERTTVKETGGTGWVWILEIGRFPPNSVDLADKSAEIWLRNRFRRGWIFPLADFFNPGENTHEYFFHTK